jgi:hypothetical protein
MKKNYLGVASLIAFACAVPVPLILVFLDQSRFTTFAHQQGPGMLWIAILWIGGFTTVGVIIG